MSIVPYDADLKCCACGGWFPASGVFLPHERMVPKECPLCGEMIGESGDRIIWKHSWEEVVVENV